MATSGRCRGSGAQTALAFVYMNPGQEPSQQSDPLGIKYAALASMDKGAFSLLKEDTFVICLG